MSLKKNIAILGSTGSIGTQTLEVVDQLAPELTVSVLTANNRVDLLIEQALKYLPHSVVIVNEQHYDQLKSALAHTAIQVLAGEHALEEVVTYEGIDIVLTALVGFAGLTPTIKAIEAGKDIALANKETLVVAGELIMRLAAQHQVAVIPVDSEHSALFQCMVGEKAEEIEKVILTASGGPFRGYSLDQLQQVTAAQALKHPNWEMGAKVTIDSASMMNKGLEVIEAKWLFDLSTEQIDVVVHPQSIIHSMVQFTDGSIKAQMGLPDMRFPIQYALTYPHRSPNNFSRYDFTQPGTLTFEQIDTDVFRNLYLAYLAMNKGGNSPCILNAANEITNLLFRREAISFVEIAEVNEAATRHITYVDSPSLADLIDTDRATRLWVTTQFSQIKI